MDKPPEVTVLCWFLHGDVVFSLGGEKEYTTHGMSPHIQDKARSLIIRGFNGKALQILKKFTKGE